MWPLLARVPPWLLVCVTRCANRHQIQPCIAWPGGVGTVWAAINDQGVGLGTALVRVWERVHPSLGSMVVQASGALRSADKRFGCRFLLRPIRRPHSDRPIKGSADWAAALTPIGRTQGLVSSPDYGGVKQVHACTHKKMQAASSPH